MGQLRGCVSVSESVSDVRVTIQNCRHNHAVLFANVLWVSSVSLYVNQSVTYMSVQNCRHNKNNFKAVLSADVLWVSYVSLSVGVPVTYMLHCRTVGIIMQSYSQTMTRRALGQLCVTVRESVSDVRVCVTVHNCGHNIIQQKRCSFIGRRDVGQLCVTVTVSLYVNQSVTYAYVSQCTTVGII